MKVGEIQVGPHAESVPLANLKKILALQQVISRPKQSKNFTLLFQIVPKINYNIV